MRKSILFMLILGVSFLIHSQTITEEVSVDWWVLPVFAVDPNGGSVLDLKAEDIELSLNGKRIDQFYLYRQTFTRMSQNQSEVNPLKKEKLVFLIFDTALSTSKAVEHSKRIAEKIVNHSSDDQKFIIMSILPFTGLKYLEGPSSEKSIIINGIDRKIKGGAATRIVDVNDFIASTSGNRGSKYSEEDIDEVIRPGVENYSRHKNMPFFQSFELLYFALNSIKDNKFIYFFTEGISKASQTGGKHLDSVYRQYLQQVAGFLGKSGAVLFVINPSGADDSGVSASSGGDSLQYLAYESGGRYLKGSDEKISSEVENIHRAYYEIAFSDPETARGPSRKVTLKSKRPSVSIHTLRSLEMTRDYSEMNTLEKEILALNLVGGNPIFHIGLSVEELSVKETKGKNKEELYTIQVPDRFIGKDLDLFRIWINSKTGDAEVESTSIRIGREQTEITMKKNEGSESRILLVDPASKTALLKGGEKRLKTELGLPPETEEEHIEVVAPAEYDEKLKEILLHASDYCTKLEDSVFHFVCREKIIEKTEELELEYRSTPGRDYGDVNVGREGMDDRIRRRNTTTNRYIHDYQLIKKGQEIIEQRLPVKSGKTNPVLSGIESRMKTFFSKKIVLAPVLLLSREWQKRYHFEFKGNETIKGRPMIVLNAVPITIEDDSLLYGTLWIDRENYSVRKIKVNPRAIKGYEMLKAMAAKFRAELSLIAEIEYDKERDGLRFPSRITVTENYRGGPVIIKLKGKRGWERSRTVYNYQDYRFFNVEIEDIQTR